MSSGSVYRQLLLLDGTNSAINLLANIQDLSTIPTHCDVRIFCNQGDTTIRDSLNGLRNVSHITAYESSNPVEEMLNVLQDNIFKCSLILVICGETVTCKWNNTKEAKMNTRIIKMDSSSTTVSHVRNALEHERRESVQKLKIVNDQSFSQYICPRCSRAFGSNDILEEHYNHDHIPIMHNDIHHDYAAKVPYNARSNKSDRYKPELFCIPCDQGFQTLEARENHIKQCTSTNKSKGKQSTDHQEDSYEDLC